MFITVENAGRHMPLSALPFAVIAGGLPILARNNAKVLFRIKKNKE